MKNAKCVICPSPGAHGDVIYQSHGKVVTIPLCYHHSVQFFKAGQTTFIQRYNSELKNFQLSTKVTYDFFSDHRRFLANS